MSQNWLEMSASDLGRGIGSGGLDPVELTEAFLDAIGSHPFAERIYARVTPERARAEARAAAARSRAGTRRSLLDGVPISWKDLFDSAGTATEAGTALLKGRVPAEDAKVLQNATMAGLVCLGKTHLTELAFSGLGLNPITATPPCVNDHDAVSGGSSSGAATSVAFGLAAAGIGSDTGGSVRIPAAWNDLVGLKTTAGRLSLQGVVPLASKFDTVGPLCRTVEDAAQLLAVMEGSEVADLTDASLNGASLAVLETIALEDVRDAPARGFDLARSRLEAAGASVTSISIPEVSDAMALSPVLFAPEGYAQWRHLIEANPEKMFDRVRVRFEGGRDVLAIDYLAGVTALERYRAAYRQATAAYDAVILPSAPIMPPNAERLLNDPAFFDAENLLALRNTRIGNLMGLAAVTLPTGVPSTGIILQGQAGQEERLLRLCKAAEAALA